MGDAICQPSIGWWHCAFFSLVEAPDVILDHNVKFMQIDIGKQRRAHPSNNLAKLPFDPSVKVPRTRLRPHYGDGFDGAPLTVRRPRGEG